MTLYRTHLFSCAKQINRLVSIWWQYWARFVRSQYIFLSRKLDNQLRYTCLLAGGFLLNGEICLKKKSWETNLNYYLSLWATGCTGSNFLFGWIELFRWECPISWHNIDNVNNKIWKVQYQNTYLIFFSPNLENR